MLRVARRSRHLNRICTLCAPMRSCRRTCALGRRCWVGFRSIGSASAVLGLLLASGLVLLPPVAWSGEIILPANALDRDAQVQVLYRATSPGTGKGQLTVSWTDVYDRLIAQQKLAFDLRNSTDVAFKLDL